MQQETILRLGDCLIGIYSDIQLATEEETKDFIVKTNEKPVYTYRFLKVNKIVVPQDVPCIQWGQWWIYQPGGRECHIRRTDDGDSIPYMSFYQTGEKEYCVEYLPMIEPHLGINRFTLSFMALEARMLEQQGVILHCSFVKYKDYGILFSAPSGTGKSTQADLWAKYKDCEIMNGDRALIQKQGNDFFVYGWPVCGSSEISKNTCVPIKAIVQLSQGKENVVTVEEKGERMKKLIPEVTVNRWNVESYMKALDLMEELETNIPIISYSCNISEDAVNTLESYLFPQNTRGRNDMKDIEVEEALVLRATQAEVPLNGTFELTPVCNMKCKMCYARLEPSVVKEKGGLRSGKEWLAVAKEAAEAGTLFVLLTGGEPLLHPDFKEIYLGLQQMGMIVSVNTNGTLLDEEWAEFFAQHKPRKINITLYGASEDTYEQVCSYRAGYEKTLKAIGLLTSKGVAVKMNGTLISDNAHEYDQMEQLAKEMDVYLKVDSYIFPYARRADAHIAEMRITPEEQGYYKYCEKKTKDTFIPYVEYAKEVLPFIDNEEEGHPQPVECRAGRSSYWIDWRHKVTPCIFLTDFSVGLEEGFTKAWEECKNWIRQLTLYAGCENCPGRKFCGVCAAALYSEEGEYHKKPEYLCQCTKEYIKKLAAYEEE